MHVPVSILDRNSLVSLLSNPLQLDWRPHGIGMLKTYLDPATRYWRLDLWHSCLITPNISTLHTHPWLFNSKVLAGELTNHVYARGDGSGVRYHEGTIGCGSHYRGLEGRPKPVRLTALSRLTYLPGESYSMLPEDIHCTSFKDGTITVINRGDPVSKDEHASVFWPVGKKWGDATMKVDEATIQRVAAECLEQLELTR